MPARITAGPPDLFLGGRLRKGLRRALIVALLVGCAGVIVAYRLRIHRGAVPAPTPEPLPTDAQQAATGFSFTRSEGHNLVFTVRAQRSIQFEGTRGTTLEGVEVEIFGRKSDQHDLLTTQSCEYNSDSGDFFCAGLVKIELNAPRAGELPPARAPAQANAPVVSRQARGHQPIYLETSHLTYSQQRSVAATAAPVKWRYGEAWGSAVGLTYATRDSCIELERDVAANWPVRGPKGTSAPSVLKLTAGHLRYAKAEQRIELAGPVHVAEDDARLEADHAIVYLDARNRLTGALLDGGVSASDPAGNSPLTAEAASLQVGFDPLSGELRQLDASGSAHAELSRGPASGITRLTADHVHVGFAGAHFHPDQGFATGNVRLISEPDHTAHVAPRSSNPSQGSLRSEELDAAELQFAFHFPSSTLERANTVGAGKLILIPAAAKEGKRVLTAGDFHMAFDSQGRLTNLRGSPPTRIVFEPAPSAPPGTAAADSRADNLQAKFNPASQALESLQQSGRYQLLDGDRQATAHQADYSADENVVTLTGKPTLQEPGTRMAADRFVFQLATNSSEGTGHVTSTHFGPLEETPGSRGVSPARQPVSQRLGEPTARGMPALPAISLRTPTAGDTDASGDTTNVLADRVVADRAGQSLHYEGHVRAWHGAHVVEAPSLDIYRADHRIVAAEGVLTSDLAPAPENSGASHNSNVRAGDSTKPAHSTRDGKIKPSAVQPVTIGADRLEYLELGRTAAYRGHVRMRQGDATLEADRLDAHFSEATRDQPSELERAVASGSVVVVEPGRRATGNHAEYFAADGRIELSGGPPTLYDAQNGFTTGQILTFYTRSDTLQVDGGEGFRALSKHHLSR
jgi:lipopolysaccharide export system protein LptA